ncbi:hypothetical protein HYS91_01090 [Candidatus Daviesbacteria bacterium]|nr:hypothetical protein [Candidatus Daviesbacteria bacterium]
MNNIKTISLVIIFSILIGVAIFFITNKNTPTISNIKSFNFSQNIDPSPSSSPTPEPVDENTNLMEQLEKNIPEDFSQDFEEIKNMVNNY